jgi:hypothetical protein
LCNKVTLGNQYSDSRLTESDHFDIQRTGIRHFNTGKNDTQHNDTQHNDTQHNDTQHNDTQHNDTQHNNTQLKNAKHED